MSADGEREFDRMLGEHLAATLNPQVGRAGRAFAQTIHQDRQRQLRSRRWFAVASGASLIAASVALALVLWRPEGDGGSTRVVNSAPLPQPAPPAMPLNADPPPSDVQKLVAWQTFDEGVDKIQFPEKSGHPGQQGQPSQGGQGAQSDQPLPVHRLRQEAVEQIEWVDPSDRSTVRLLVPRQQVLLIKQDTY